MIGMKATFSKITYVTKVEIRICLTIVTDTKDDLSLFLNIDP